MVMLVYQRVYLLHLLNYMLLPSGKLLYNYGKSPLLMGKSTINGDFQ